MTIAPRAIVKGSSTELVGIGWPGSVQLKTDHVAHAHFQAFFSSPPFSGGGAENQGDPNGWPANTASVSIDDAGRLLVAANQNALTVRQGTTDTAVSANLAVFRVNGDGTLEFVRKYDVVTGGGRSLMWAGFLTLLGQSVLDASGSGDAWRVQ